MIIAINYSDKMYKKAQEYNTKTAYSRGKVDKVIEYDSSDIDDDFFKKYSTILNQKRGGGYWLWKPYIIKRTLELAEDGDYIFYTDSGSYYLNKVSKLVKSMEENNQFIMSFSLPLVERNFTKRDVFEYFNMWESKYMDSRQRLATFILLRKCEESVDFIDEYLKAATTRELITDAPSINQPEDKFFIENRHDQSIYSLLCKKWGLKEFRDPSEYGNKPELYNIPGALKTDYIFETKCDYPQIMTSHRKKNPTLMIRLDVWFKRKLPTNIYLKYSKIRDRFINIFRK